MRKTVDETFNWGESAFKRANLLKKSACRIRVYAGKEETIVVISELAENKGRSITNGAEQIIELACDRYKLDFANCLWIEHYPPTEGQPEETVDRVILIANKNKQIFEENLEAKWEAYPKQKLEQKTQEKL